MPELPEVETIRRGLMPYVLGETIRQVIVRQRYLRWPVPQGIARRLQGQVMTSLERRGKYLCVSVGADILIVHFGMSGCLRLLSGPTPAGPHDHLDIALINGSLLRFQDPRRFGSIHLCRDPLKHPLLARLGPEPLTPAFNGAYLVQACFNRRAPIKNILMNNKIVAGIGNIYANEALFSAGIRPSRPSNRLSVRRLRRLTSACKQTLEQAIQSGGTTLRDFVDSAGKPGFFQLSARVYGRPGEKCTRCAATIRHERLSGRATFYCPRCQR